MKMTTKTLRISIKGDEKWVREAKEMLLWAEYIRELDTPNVTIEMSRLRITIVFTDEEVDGTLLMYSPLDEASWKTIMAIPRNGLTVVAGWYKVTWVEDGQRQAPPVCPFTDVRAFHLPHFALGFAEEIWAPVQYIAEQKYGPTLPDLVEELSAPYWGD